jgi:hypothetical protein
MDLALHLGMTSAGLGRAMTERELGQWRAYAAKRMLPMRRVELYLAQIALLVVKTMGGQADAKLSDYLFDPEPEAEELDLGDENIDADDIAAFFGARRVGEAEGD